MAEINSPTGEPTGDAGRGNAVPAQTSPTGPGTEPDTQPAVDSTATTAIRKGDGARDTVDPDRVDLDNTATTDARGTDSEREETSATRPALAAPASAAPAPVAPAPPTPAEPQPVIPPATAEQSAAPHKQGNRLVGTLWVLLAAGIFQVIFFGANALIALAFGGPSAIWDQVNSIAETSLAWLPVLLFFLLFELVVLITNRAGRVVYVFASLIVGALVYVLTVVLFSLIVRHSLGDANILAQTFLNYEFILIGLVAREVMLWTGLAIGSRGIRVRRRNREARRRYNDERTDART